MDFELSSMSAEFAGRRWSPSLRVEVDADRPVQVSFLSPEEFSARPDGPDQGQPGPPGPGVVRVIDIEGLDRQADGGTHVARPARSGPSTWSAA